MTLPIPISISIPRHLMAAAFFGIAVFCPRMEASLWWGYAPGAVAQGTSYEVSAENTDSYYASIDIYKDGEWVGYEDTYSSPYGYNYNYDYYYYDEPYGCIIYHTSTDDTPGPVTYEAMDNYGNTITHIVTITGGTAPVAQVVVDGETPGAVVLRPAGGSVNLSVRFTASDADGDLSGIRPNKWNATANQLDNNGGAFVTVVGSSAEVVHTYAIDTDGDYYFWGEVRPAVNGAYVTSGAYQNGFLIRIREAGKPEMALDSLTAIAANGRMVEGMGWAADFTNGIVDRVEVWIEGRYFGDATLGDIRPDVAARFGMPDLLAGAGFHFAVEAQGLSLGNHSLVLKAYAQDGGMSQVSRYIKILPENGYGVNGQEAWLPDTGLIPDYYHSGTGPNYPGRRTIGTEGSWYNSASNATLTGSPYLTIQQNGDRSLTYSMRLGGGSAWKGNEAALFIKDPVSRYVLEVGYEEWHEEYDYNYGYYDGWYEWASVLVEYFDSLDARDTRMTELQSLYPYYEILESESTHDWRVVHSRFWGAENTAYSTMSETISPNNGWAGREMAMRAWSFQRVSTNDRKVQYYTTGNTHFFTFVEPPAVNIQASGTARQLGQSLPLSSLAQAATSDLAGHGFEYRKAIASSGGNHTWGTWHGESSGDEWTERFPALPYQIASTGSSAVTVDFLPQSPGFYQFRGVAWNTSGMQAESEPSQVVTVGNSAPAIDIDAPEEVEPGAMFILRVAAENPAGANACTGLRVMEWRGADGVTPPASDDAGWVCIENRIFPQPGVEWARYIAAGDSGQIVYQVCAWNGDNNGGWMSETANSQSATVVINSTAGSPATSRTTVMAVVLDAAQNPIVPDEDDCARMPMSSEFYLSVSAQTGTGGLESLQAIVINSTGAQVAAETVAVSGTSAQALFGPFQTGDFAGQWGMQAIATKQWGGGAQTTVPLIYVTTDRQSPIPQGLAATNITANSLTLSWQVLTGATVYEVSRDGVVVGTTTSLTMDFSGLAANVIHVLRVRAGDAEGNWSAWSKPLPVQTVAAQTSSRTPTGLRVLAATATTLKLTWNLPSDTTGQYYDYCEVMVNGQVVTNSAYPASWNQYSYTIGGLVPETIYTISVKKRYSSGTSDFCAPILARTTTDVTPPNAPGGLRADDITHDSCIFSWYKASDDIGAVLEYKVYSNGRLVATIPSDGAFRPFVEITGLSPGRFYQLSVRAVDAAGNISGEASTIIKTMSEADEEPPSVPANLRVLRLTNTWLTLAWDESTDNARVSWYELFQDGQSLGLVPPSSAAFYDITGFQPGQTVTYSVRARDISGNYSGNSTPLVLTTTDYDDTEAPYLDWNFWVTNTGVNGFTINWDAGTDNVGVVAYEISGIGDVPVETTSTSYTFTGLYPDAWYWFNIRARDAAGNWSDMINCGTCTDYEDYYDYNWDILPTTPQSLHVTSSSESYIALAWEPSQHPAGVVAYDIYRDGDYLDLTWDPYLSYVDVNVEAGQSYTYTVVAWTYDNQSNPSDAVTAIATGSSIYTLSPPSELAVYDVGTSSFAISWTPAPAPVGYPWFRLFVNGQLKGSVPPYSKPFCLITDLTAGTDYTVTICMLDVLGNVSAESAPVSVTTLLMPPAGLHLENKTHGTITLAWSAPADATGITAYEIMRNDTTIATVGPDTFLYTDQNLAAATYLYHVVAVNNAGGRSAPSGPLSVLMEENSLAAWAESNGLNPDDAQDMLDDPDGDGLTNIAEFNLGKNPHSYDQGSSTLGTAVPAGWPAPNSADTHAMGATAGEFSVDKNGAATYTVPIAVTPGTAGVEPKITLNYSSQAGPGIAGFGWSIGGLSAISRGPQTKLVDGQNRAMDFTRNDRFYLDGQRLVVINGTYSYDGAEYRTEMESFTRVVSYGSTGNSPAWFKAWTKGGLVIEFGHTADSAFRPQNQTDPLSWAVSKISDTVGNYMTFHYEVEVTSGQQVLKSIKYTGHDGTPSLQPYASLEFEYEPRPDTSFGYVVGAKISSLQRLTAIKSRHGSAVVRTYALNYSQRDYNKRSILDSITEAGADGVAYHPLTFAYSNPPGGMQAVPDFFHLPTFIARADANGRLADQGVVFIDLNGDGRTDCVQKLGANGSVVNRAWLNTPDGWVPATGTNGQPDYRLPNPLTLSANNRNATNPDTGVRFADFNNDGLVDIMGPTGNVYLNTGAGFLLNQRFSLPDEPPPDDNNYYYDWFSRGWPETLDLDGDGRTDVSARSSFEYTEYDSYYDEYIYHSYEAHDTWINTGGGDEGVRGSAWEHAPEHTVPLARGDTGVRYVDINGDGLTDILQSCGTIRRAYIKNPSGWSNTTAYHLPLPLFSGYSTTTGLGGELTDLNGDGLPDFIAYNNGSSNYQNAAYINTGKGWIPAPPTMLPPTALYYNNTPNGAAFIDFDTDGLPDLLAGNSATHLNTGSGWMTATPDYRLPRALYQYNRGNPGNEFIDLNADGAADLIWSWQDGSTSTKGAYVNSRVNPDRLASVTNGLGVTVFVAYAPLTETTTTGGGDPVYEKDTGASFPVTDAIGPMHVVKTVSHEDGAGGWYDIGYRYGGLRFHAERGSLGFAWMQVTDSRTQIRTKTLFNQTHPFTGLPDGAITAQENGTPLSETATTYEYLSLNNGKTIFPYAAETIQKTYELNGDLTSETVTTYAYDTFGNATVIEIDTSGGDAVFTKTVTSTYENWVSAPSGASLGGWMLGRLLSSTVTTTAPNPDGGAPLTQTRTSDFEYSTTTGLLTTEIIEPDAPDDPVTQAPSPLKLTTTYAHDSFGNKTTVTTTGAGLGNGRTATTTYTANGRFPLKTANALGHEETYAYDPALGVLLSTTGPNGLTTRWEYDALARPSREIRADGAVSITRQCWAGPGVPEGALYYIETESTASAPAVTFYDKMGRAISSWNVNPGGHDGLARIVTTETLYNKMGCARATSLPHYLGEDAPGWSEILSYDILNRPLQVSTPDDEADGGAVVSSIEYAGLVTRTTNPLGQVEEATKDTQGRIIKRINNATETTDLSQRGEIRYYYDAYGNLLKTAVHNEDGTAVETTFEYDNRGRKTGMTSPDMGTWTYHYNALAELVSQTDAKGQTTTMTYDVLGRLATRTDRDASDAVACTTTWTYDDITTSGPKSKGKLSAVLVETTGKPDYKETYIYDDLGRQICLTRRIDGADYSVGQEYDSFGRPAVTIYPGGFRVRNIYSTLGFLKEVRADGGLAPSGWLGDVRLNHLFWQADTYTVTGAISGGAIGNGLTYDRDVSPVTGRVRAVVSGIGLGTHAQYHVYNYDKLGQVVQREDLVLGRKETFAYDGLNRLTQYNVEAASLPLGSTGATGIPPVIPKTVTQTYNALGNITQKSDYGIYSYSGINAGPHAVTSVYDTASDTTRTYTYDANGNQTSGAGRTLNWTIFNQVETITQGATSTQFRFGAGRERVVQEHSNGTKTIYIGDLYEKVTNTATGLTEEKYNIYSPFGKVATRTVRSDASIETRYYHLDGLGSIVAVSDEWGRVEKRFTFDPWGKREMPLDTHAGQGGEVTRGFTGHEHLDDFGLIHMNGRIFDPALGRFLSPDSYVNNAEWSQSYNRYSYVDNNPLNATDPSGYFSLKSILPAIIAIVVIVVITVCSYGTLTVPASASIWAVMGIGAAGGFAGAFSAVLLNGGSLGDAFRAGLKGAAIGALTAAASYGIGGYFGKAQGIWADTATRWTGRTLAHAIVGGVTSELQGGAFRHGFYSSAFSAGFMHIKGVENYMSENTGGWHVAGRTAIAAVIGGTAAELSGGKFANGAVTSAMQHLFNSESRKAEERNKLLKEELYNQKNKYTAKMLEQSSITTPKDCVLSFGRTVLGMGIAAEAPGIFDTINGINGWAQGVGQPAANWLSGVADRITFGLWNPELQMPQFGTNTIFNFPPHEKIPLPGPYVPKFDSLNFKPSVSVDLRTTTVNLGATVKYTSSSSNLHIEAKFGIDNNMNSKFNVSTKWNF